jgi:hypothetical protein
MHVFVDGCNRGGELGSAHLVLTCSCGLIREQGAEVFTPYSSAARMEYICDHEGKTMFINEDSIKKYYRPFECSHGSLFFRENLGFRGLDKFRGSDL